MAIKRAFSPFSTITAALLMSLAACSEESSPAPAPQEQAAPATESPSPTSPPPSSVESPRGSGEKVAVPIDSSVGGKVVLSDGTELEIPAGALPPGVTTITVTSSTKEAPAEYKTVAPIYVFEPDGTVFSKPVKISFPVTVPAGTNLDDLTILWSRPRGRAGFDMVPATFTPSGSGTNTFVVSGEVNHFSEGTCGLKFTTDPFPSDDPYKD